MKELKDFFTFLTNWKDRKARENHDKLNRLLRGYNSGQLSLSERDRLARELNCHNLQIAVAAHIPQAQTEQERRRERRRMRWIIVGTIIAAATLLWNILGIK